MTDQEIVFQAFLSQCVDYGGTERSRHSIAEQVRRDLRQQYRDRYNPEAFHGQAMTHLRDEWSNDRVGHALARLREAGKVDRSDRRGWWRITDPGSVADIEQAEKARREAAEARRCPHCRGTGRV